MKFEIKKLNKKDYNKIIQYAIKGMHFNMYLANKLELNLYGRYFWYLELTNATHLINIYNENELDKNSTYSKMELVKKEGDRNVKKIEFYNLDAIISAGYRVNSLRTTQFRRWVTNVLKTFTIQGYVLDKERMKNGSFIDKDYFEKLLEEIREIRLSERRFYQKITDIYATSVDYDKKSPTTIKFFKKVQNKMHFAISKQNAWV